MACQRPLRPRLPRHVAEMGRLSNGASPCPTNQTQTSPGALISCSNQRPDTLMQDQKKRRIDENLLRRTAGPYIGVMSAVFATPRRAGCPVGPSRAGLAEFHLFGPRRLSTAGTASGGCLAAGEDMPAGQHGLPCSARLARPAGVALVFGRVQLAGVRRT
jgi:hypothetical protein